MRDGGRIPVNALVYKSLIHTPPNEVGAPFDLISMKVLGCIEAQPYKDRGAPVTIFQLRSILTGVVVNVHQHPGRVPSEKLNIDLLPWRIAVQEHPRHQARHA